MECLSAITGIPNALSKLMTKEQIDEAQVLARKCEASNYKQCD
jgi:hypothetical protein